jgi:geranylgeranyl reductase family protein
MNACDIAVVGAGPSGAWTAYRLAIAGARVVLFDPSHPREKPCGGGVTGRALALVRDAVTPADFPAVPIRRARFVSSGDGLAAAPAVPLGGGALVVASRSHFDARLLDAARSAGASHVAARVTTIERDHGGFRLATTTGDAWRCRTIVGADGPNGIVRRRLSTAYRRDQLSIATGFFAHGVTSDEIVLELISNPPGYLWSFPRTDHLAIGICAQADAGLTAGDLRARAAAWIERTGIARGATLTPYSWPIPSLDARDSVSADVAGDGWLLVGDAAGFVDPLTREGIFYALESADVAARAILGQPDAAARVYEAGLRETRREIARAASLKRAFFRPAFIRLTLAALAESPRVRAVMADLVAGSQSYRDLKWRLARTCEMGLAWRLMRMQLAGSVQINR